MVYTGIFPNVCVEFDKQFIDTIKDRLEVFNINIPDSVYEKPFKSPSILKNEGFLISGVFIKNAVNVSIPNENIKFWLPLEALKIFESYK